MSKRRCTAEATLFTFCPPAPWVRTAFHRTSCAARASAREIRIMSWGQRGVLAGPLTTLAIP